MHTDYELRASATRLSEPAARGAVVGLLVAACLWVTGSGSVQAEPRLMNLPAPLGAGEPVVVRVGFDLRDINEIDDESETFEFKAVLTFEWHDERQSFDPAVEGVSEKLYQGTYQFDEVFDGWFPQVVLVNEAGLYEQLGVLLRVRPDGSLRLIQSISAAAEADLNLRAYPFDDQQLKAVFEVLGFDESEVVLEPAVHTGSGEAAVRLPQWDLTQVGVARGSYRAPHAGESGVASTVVVSLDVERKSFFMVRLVILPLVLIVMLSWSVFWMDQSSLGDRISVSFIGILTIVAYQIVLSEILPRISYFTLMNGFMNFSFWVICASVLVNLRVGWLDRNGQSAAGDRLDRRSRWAFPLLYAALLLLVISLTRYFLTLPPG